MATDYRAPVGQWTKFSMRVDFAAKSYSAFAGETQLATNIPYTPPPPRTTMQNGVNIEIPVPSYKAFKQVLFQPVGKDSRIYVDDVSVTWQPDLVFAPPGKVAFEDDFEAMPRETILSTQPAWQSTGDGCRVISSTSYREGVKSVAVNAPAKVEPRLTEPVVLKADSVVIFDADMFIRSTAPVALIIPNQATASEQIVTLGIGELALTSEKSGKWTLTGTGNTGTQVPFDCWMHVQLSLDLKTRTLTAVHQQIGQVAEKIGTAKLPDFIQPGQELPFSFQFEASPNGVIFDNVRISHR